MKARIILILLAACTFAACDKDNNNIGNPPSSANNGNITGQGGSLARFTIAKDYMYIVDGQKLYAYSLANAANPVMTNTINIGFNIETIYSYKDRLFIGSQDAMYVYSIDNPASPSKLGQASHIRACDPVVANDSMAYVTVRAGSFCGGGNNELITYDVSNSLLNPQRVHSVTLNNPYGLGLGGDRLYVCDGSSGLKVFSLANPEKPYLLRQVLGDTFYDIIVDGNLLICMVDGGTALYETSAGDKITKLAMIK